MARFSLTSPRVYVDIEGMETGASNLCASKNLTTEADLTAYINSQTRAPAANPTATVASLQAALIDLQAKYDEARTLLRQIANSMYKMDTRAP